jgi:hypothetical protein
VAIAREKFDRISRHSLLLHFNGGVMMVGRTWTFPEEIALDEATGTAPYVMRKTGHDDSKREWGCSERGEHRYTAVKKKA